MLHPAILKYSCLRICREQATPAAIWTQTPGHYDWVDAPGLSSVSRQLQRIVSASETFDFQSSLTNEITGSSCSVDWSLQLTVKNGGAQWIVKNP